MRVVALDLSLSATGFADESGVCVLSPPKNVDGIERLSWFRTRIQQLLDGDEQPDLGVIEDYAFSRASQAHAKGELGGVVRLMLHDQGLPIALINPKLRAKYATGNGNAAKEEVFAAAIRRMAYKGNSLDEADALWLRAMALDHYGADDVVDVPKAHRVALDKVEWPELRGLADAIARHPAGAVL